MLRADVRAAFLPSARDRNCCHLRAEGVSRVAVSLPCPGVFYSLFLLLSPLIYATICCLQRLLPTCLPSTPCLPPVQASASSNDLFLVLLSNRCHVWLFYGLSPARLPSPWDFPGKNTGVGCHFFLQGIFLTQESNPHLLRLLHWQVDSLPLPPGGRGILPNTSTE